MKPVTAPGVEYICWNMREADRAEVFGLRSHDNPLILARETLYAASMGKAALAFHNDRPAAILGISPLWAGVWSAWSFGTEDWPKVAGQLTRHALKTVKPFIAERAHRLQCESRVDHIEAHKWLKRLGAEPEGLLRGYGRDGADYIMFSWRRR